MSKETTEQLGFDKAPDRYNKGDRECIDIIRDSMSDEAFADYCYAQVIRYLYRGDSEKPGSKEKAQWYLQMYNHMIIPQLIADPRQYREGFKPYERKDIGDKDTFMSEMINK